MTPRNAEKLIRLLFFIRAECEKFTDCFVSDDELAALTRIMHTSFGLQKRLQARRLPNRRDLLENTLQQPEEPV